jgi:hypothetical protein
MDLSKTLITLAIYLLAVARITRLINADTIMDPLRISIAGRSRSHLKIAQSIQAFQEKDELYQHHRKLMFRWERTLEFVQCPWCVGMWVALFAAPAPVWFLHWSWWTTLPVALAASHLVGVTAALASTEDMSIEDDADS